MLWLRKADNLPAGSAAQGSSFVGAATVATRTAPPAALESPGGCRAGEQEKSTARKWLGVKATLAANASATSVDALETNLSQTSRIRVPLPPQRHQ